MTLEQIIRHAVAGILLAPQGGDFVSYETINDEIQELMDILIDFGNITGEQLIDILNKC